MTKDELERIIFSQLSDLEVANSFSNLTEEQRRKLSTHVVSLKQQIVNGKPKQDASQLVIDEIKSINEVGFWNRGGIKKVQLAIHAICSFSVIKSRGQGYIGRLSKELSKIYSDRKPEWLGEWLEFEFSQERPRIPITTIYQWISKDLCNKPSAEGYTAEFVKFFAEEHRESNQDSYLTLSQRLKQNIEHLDDIWKMFKVEHDGFNANYFHTNRRDYDTPEVIEEWPEVILTFAEEGLLDRQRLLDEILDGLHNDIKQNQLSGMHKLFDQFKPRFEEISVRDDKLISLLSHKVGHIVKFSLKNLGKLEKANTLDLYSFLAEVPAVFTQVAKGNSILALKLLDALIKKDKDNKLSCQFIVVLRQALQHPDVDVQNLALNLLSEIKQDISTENMQELEAIAEYITSSLRPQLFAVIEKQTYIEEPTLPQIDRQEIIKLIRNTPKQTLINLGLEEIDLSQQDIGQIKPIKSDFPVFPIKEHCKKIESIEDIDSLIQVISSAVEGLDDCNDFERILDGISRLCDTKDNEFNDKVAPLLHRLSKEFERHESLIAFRGCIRVAFKSLLLSWLIGSHEELRKKHYYIEYETLISRLENLQNRILKKQAYPLLSAPSHENGWIDPEIWVARIHQFQQSGMDLDRHDFCQSLMRLMPLNRQNKDHTLLKAQIITGDLGRVARFALGAELEINRKDKKDYDLWITAARCLSPLKDWSDEFKVFKLKNDFPGGVKPTQLEFSITADEEYNYAKFEQNIIFGKDKQLYEFDDSVFNKLKMILHYKHSLSWDQLPTIAIHRHDAFANFWSYHIGNTWLSQWMYSLWPNNSGPLTAIAINGVSGHLDTKSSNITPTYGCFQGLLQTPYPFSYNSHILLFMGLNAGDQDAKYACIDAYIEAVDHGKLNEKYAAEALIQLIEGKDTKFNRISDALKQITPISSLHAYSVSQIIQQVLCKIDLKLRNLFHMTELLLELLIELQIPLSQQCHSKLTAIKGSSKMAKAAKQLIALDFNSENIKDLKLGIIESRLKKIL